MSSRARDPWLDNAKMALVTLVVIGHTWTLLPDEGLSRHLYDFLYAWHVPAFVLVTGYLSRSFSYAPERLWQLVRTVLVPYVVFECLMSLFRVHVGGEKLEDLFADPHWPMWYLAALFFWRLLTPVFRPLPAGVPVAVVISVAAGLWAGDTLDVARVLGLLPFFVVGLKCTPERLERLRGAIPATLAVGFFVALWFLARYTDDLAQTEWLYYRALYSELDVSDSRAVVTRLCLLAIGVVGSLAFLALVPRRGGWFARMGGATLVVYLLHGFAVKALEYSSFPGWAVDHPGPALAAATAGAVALSLLLASPPVFRFASHLVDPLGSAEKQVTEAVGITAVAQEVEQETEHGDRLEQAPPGRDLADR